MMADIARLSAHKKGAFFDHPPLTRAALKQGNKP
jgi:hypothetical protein